MRAVFARNNHFRRESNGPAFRRWGLNACGLKFAVAGCLICLGGAIAATCLLRTMLYGVSSLDPMVLTLAAFFVLALAMLASFVPARRAAGIEPMQALLSE
ncbi:MAG: hypothetical protein WA399_05870 [Acidobacteriaceae bacterium]